jgi:hypothetical protein
LAVYQSNLEAELEPLRNRARYQASLHPCISCREGRSQANQTRQNRLVGPSYKARLARLRVTSNVTRCFHPGRKQGLTATPKNIAGKITTDVKKEILFRIKMKTSKITTPPIKSS